MKVKLEYIVLVVIIAVLAGYLAMRNSDRTLYELPNIPEKTAKDFTRIEITGKGSSIKLTKRDEIWSIQPQGYPVDPGRMDGILATLSTLKTTALASETKDYQRYELDDNRKIQVIAWSGDDIIRQFEIGKAAPSFRHTFIRLDKDHRVFHARDNFRSKFDPDVTALQHKTALELKTASVKSFVIGPKAGGTEFKLQTGEGENAPAVWQRSDGMAADRSAVDKLLGAVSNLRHQGFIDQAQKADFAKPIYSMTLNEENSHTLSIFAKRESDPDQYPAISSGVDFPFFLSDTQVQQIMQKPEDLMPKPEDQKVEEGDANKAQSGDSLFKQLRLD